MTLAICQVLRECPGVRVVVRRPPLVRAGVTLYERLINYLLHGLRRD